MAESGFFPSIIIYFSLWYCKKEQTMRIAILYGAAIISGAFGGILVCTIEFHNYGLRDSMVATNLGTWYCTDGRYRGSERLAMDVFAGRFT